MKKTILTRILVLCLMLSLVATLAACGNKNSSSNEPASSEAEEPAEEEPEEEPAEEPEEPEENASTIAVPEELLGKQTATSYENEYFGLRYDVPADWYLLSREEIATIMGIAATTFDDEAMANMLKETGYVTDLYVMDTKPAIDGMETFNNVNITIQDIGKLYGIIYDEKKLAEGSANTVKDALTAQGLTDIQTEISEMEFIGKNCVALTITSKAGTTNMYQKQVYLKNESALACVTATAMGEDKTDEILSVFADINATPAATSESTTEEAATAAATDTALNDAKLSSGSISIDGDVFTLGKGFNEIPAEWTLKPEDAEKYKDYTLNPRTTSGSAMGVYKEKWGYEFNSFHVMLSLVNASEASIPYLEGAIDYLDIPGISRSETVPDIIFPGGLTLESTEEDFIAAYGEPSNEYEDASTQFKKLSFRDGDIKLDIIWSKGTIDQITIMY